MLSANLKSYFFLYKPDIKAQDLKYFCWHLAMLTQHQLPLIQALKLMSHNTEHYKIQQLLQTIIRDLTQGVSLVSSLQTYPKSFSPFFCYVIQLGEQHNLLTPVLFLLQKHMQYKIHLIQTIKKMCYYPLTIILATVLLFLFVVLNTLPQFNELYLNNQLILPTSTQHLLTFSHFLIHYDSYLITIFVIVLLAFIFAGYKNHLIPALLKLGYRIPTTKKLIAYYHSLIFCHALSLGFTAHANLIETLEHIINMMPEKRYQQALWTLSQQVSQGQFLGDALKQAQCFPTLLCALFSIAEKSGSLAATADHLSKHYQSLLQQKMSSLSSKLGPILMCLAASLIMLVIMTIYCPILNLAATPLQ